MFALWPVVATFLGFVVVPLIKKLMIFFGLSFVVFAGMKQLFSQIESLMLAELGSLPSDVLSIMGIMNLDTAFSMILSAIGTRLILSGWSSTSDTKKSLYF